MFWLLISEIYPVKIRGQAMSVTTMANWAANFVVAISFLTILGILGDAGTFFLFAGLTIVALAYFARQVPETKGRSPAGHRTRPGPYRGAMSGRHASFSGRTPHVLQVCPTAAPMREAAGRRRTRGPSPVTWATPGCTR